jgi:peptidoglycan/LPS O-acetylase OafA/YrhL
MRNRLLLLGAALAAFGASLFSGFHFDDYAIFSDPVLTSFSGWMGIWALRRTQPLTNLTFWLNYLVGGRDPLGYHLLNLALHLGAVLLAYACAGSCRNARRWLRRRYSRSIRSRRRR